MSKTLQVSATIANGGTTSAEVGVPDGYQLVGIHAPICTGTALTLTAATVTGGTFTAVADKANSAVTHTISGTAHYMALDPTLYKGLQFIKLVSGSSEGADRVFSLVFEKKPT